jgi:hypothetical protein
MNQSSNLRPASSHLYLTTILKDTDTHETAKQTYVMVAITSPGVMAWQEMIADQKSTDGSPSSLTHARTDLRHKPLEGTDVFKRPDLGEPLLPPPASSNKLCIVPHLSASSRVAFSTQPSQQHKLMNSHKTSQRTTDSDRVVFLYSNSQPLGTERITATNLRRLFAVSYCGLYLITQSRSASITRSRTSRRSFRTPFSMPNPPMGHQDGFASVSVSIGARYCKKM